MAVRELAQWKRERALEAESGLLEGTGLTEEEPKALFGQMLLVRRFEDEVEQAYRRGQIGGYAHVYIGQEDEHRCFPRGAEHGRALGP
ncbi:MAG: hypothetical protein ACE5JD_09580 [Candidatus Methylomirabilia bacterium]